MTPDPLTPEQEKLVRSRQRGRANVMAILMGAFAILIFFVAIAKIKAGHS